LTSVCSPGAWLVSIPLLKGQLLRGRGVGRAGEGSARGAEMGVGRSAIGAAVGVAEETPLKQPMEWQFRGGGSGVVQ